METIEEFVKATTNIEVLLIKNRTLAVHIKRAVNSVYEKAAVKLNAEIRKLAHTGDIP